MGRVRVTVWNECIHGRRGERVRAIHPDGTHRTLADALPALADVGVRTATLDEPEHRVAPEVLAAWTCLEDVDRAPNAMPWERRAVAR